MELNAFQDLVTDDSTNEQRRMMFAKRPAQMLAMTYSKEVKFLYQVDDEDDTQLLNEDMQFLTGVEQVIKNQLIYYRRTLFSILLDRIGTLVEVCC